jgi:hypothetical protein
MNFVILFIFLFASFTTSSPLLKRQDQLSGFKQCDGEFANTITLYSYSPNPVIIGQDVKVRIAGEIKVPILSSATITISHYYNNELLFTEQSDFCKIFVEPNGSTCPLEIGNFDFSTTFPTESDPSDPKNVEMDIGVRISSTYFKII